MRSTVLSLLHSVIFPGDANFINGISVFNNFYIFSRNSSHSSSDVTITICPGPLVHRMGKVTWRNDNGEKSLTPTSVSATASIVVSAASFAW
jgi:hypothetical protein